MSKQEVSAVGNRIEKGDNPTLKKKKRNVNTTAITGVRCFMMSAIALGHMNMYYGINNVSDLVDLGGGPAVACFFVVSGFLISVAYGDKDFSKSHERSNFWGKRFARLAPLYYLSLAFSFSNILKFGTDIVQPIYTWVIVVPLTITCLQSWFLGILAGSWNGVLWSVSTIVYFYMRFPYLVSRIKSWKNVDRALSILAVIEALKFVASEVPGVGPLNWFILRAFPPAAMPIFLIGTIVGLRRASTSTPAPNSPERVFWARRADILGVVLSLAASLVWWINQHPGRFAPSDKLWTVSWRTRWVFEALIPLPFALFLEALTMATDASVAWQV